MYGEQTSHWWCGKSDHPLNANVRLSAQQGIDILPVLNTIDLPVKEIQITSPDDSVLCTVWFRGKSEEEKAKLKWTMQGLFSATVLHLRRVSFQRSSSSKLKWEAMQCPEVH